jgi:hypothetical protein
VRRWRRVNRPGRGPRPSAPGSVAPSARTSGSGRQRGCHGHTGRPRG